MYLYSNGSIQAKRLENNWKSKKEIRARTSTPFISVWNSTRPIPANSSKKSQGKQIWIYLLTFYLRHVDNSIVKYNEYNEYCRSFITKILSNCLLNFVRIDYVNILIHRACHHFLWFYFIFKVNLIIRLMLTEVYIVFVIDLAVIYGRLMED